MNEVLSLTPRETATAQSLGARFQEARLDALQPGKRHAGIQDALFQVLSETLARVSAPENLDALLTHPLRELVSLAPAPPVAAQPAPAALELLTARERDVLQRIAAGDSNKVIARAFDLSPHTVKRHVANILGKLGASSRMQAGAWLRAHH